MSEVQVQDPLVVNVAEPAPVYRARRRHLVIKLLTLVDEARHIRRNERQLQRKIDRPFAVAIEQEDDGRWLAEVEAAPGAMAYGETADEANAAAQRIARGIARAALRSERDDLAAHRRGVVRTAAREVQIALGFLDGKTYSQCEPRTGSTPDFDAIGKLVKLFGPQGDPALDGRWRAWRAEAVAHSIQSVHAVQGDWNAAKAKARTSRATPSQDERDAKKTAWLWAKANGTVTR